MLNLILIQLDKILFFAAGVSGAPCSRDQVASGNFFFLPHWWEYMQSFKIDTLGQCTPNFFFPNSIFPVGLAILDIMLRLAGLAAVIAVIYSGVIYILAMGNPEKGAEARRSIYNSLIGLGIVFTASLFVAFVGRSLTT